MKKIYAFFIIFMMPLVTFGAGLVPCGGEGENPCSSCDIIVLIERILHFALTSGVLIIIGAIIWGGLRWILSGGQEKNIVAGKHIIQSAIIGLIIVLASYIIINTTFWVIAKLGGDNYVDNWYQIECNSPPPQGYGFNSGSATGSAFVGGNNSTGVGVGNISLGNNTGNTAGNNVIGNNNNNINPDEEISTGGIENWCGDMKLGDDQLACVAFEDCFSVFKIMDTSVSHCPENTVCCIPKPDANIVAQPTNPNPPDLGGPCEGGQLMVYCPNYTVCRTVKNCSTQQFITYCAVGNNHFCPPCPNECDPNDPNACK